MSYDSTKAGDNVSWYFSPPSEAPGPCTVSLDRRTACHAGPIDSDVGPLALGNFNPTMSGYGLDRQFRGEIQALQVFGSRASGRGALKADEINLRLRMPVSDAGATKRNVGAPDPGASAEKPDADKLRAHTWQGRDGTWGQPADTILGEGKDSEASEAIIKVVDNPAPRPV